MTRFKSRQWTQPGKMFVSDNHRLNWMGDCNLSSSELSGFGLIFLLMLIAWTFNYFCFPVHCNFFFIQEQLEEYANVDFPHQHPTGKALCWNKARSTSFALSMLSWLFTVVNPSPRVSIISEYMYASKFCLWLKRRLLFHSCQAYSHTHH